MRLLLDTHILLWTLTESSMLPMRARALIADEENAVLFSTISLWEIAIKHGVRPENMTLGAEQVMRMAISVGLEPLALAPDDVVALETLRQREGSTHRDPFDRMLIAQAKARSLRFVTHDSKMGDYLEPCIKRI